MKKIIILALLVFSFQANAQLKFWNKDAGSNMPKFEVEYQTKTTIFMKVGYEVKPLYVFNKTAPQVYNGDGRTKYQMTAETSDTIAKRKFEISYTFYRQTNRYLGYIKATFTYKDKRPTKVFEENFETVVNP
jgi:hypothetical protein